GALHSARAKAFVKPVLFISRRVSVGGLVIAGCAAGLTVHEAVGADADVNRPLAEAAVLLALAGVFGFLALRAAVFRTSGSGSHGANVARVRELGKRDVGNDDPVISGQWAVASGQKGSSDSGWA